MLALKILNTIKFLIYGRVFIHLIWCGLQLNYPVVIVVNKIGSIKNELDLIDGEKIKNIDGEVDKLIQWLFGKNRKNGEIVGLIIPIN